MIKSYLLLKDKDFTRSLEKSINNENKIFDLELETLTEVMEDKELIEVLLKPLNNIDDINWRQDILKDFIENGEMIFKLKEIVSEGINDEKMILHSLFSEYPINRVERGVLVIEKFLERFEEMKRVLNEKKFKSKGLIRLYNLINENFNDEYLKRLREILKDLKFEDGIYIRGRLGKGNKLRELTLMKKEEDSFMRKIIHKKDKEYFFINERDSSGLDTLTLLKNRSLNNIGDIIENVCNGIKDFFINLDFELRFYIGGIKLYKKCIENKIDISYGEEDINFNIRGLREIVLSLKNNISVIGNNLSTGNKDLVIITGANRGGKTIFLKSIGENQILFQSGLITLAKEYKSKIFKDIFTHFKRGEDRKLTGGKLEEELERMDFLVEEIKSGSLILLNEAFSSTNDREGKIISENIVNGLIDSKVTVFFVTHNYSFAKGMWNNNKGNVEFLRASRERNFKLEIGCPLEKSYGEDIWKN